MAEYYLSTRFELFLEKRSHTCSHMHKSLAEVLKMTNAFLPPLRNASLKHYFSAGVSTFENKLEYLRNLNAVNMSYLPASRRWNVSLPSLHFFPPLLLLREAASAVFLGQSLSLVTGHV